MTTLTGYNRRARNAWVQDCTNHGVQQARQWRTQGAEIDWEWWRQRAVLPGPKPKP